MNMNKYFIYFNQAFYFLIVGTMLTITPAIYAQNNYPISYFLYICHDENGRQAAQFSLSGESRFIDDVQIECNGGVGDDMKDCWKVIYYREEKLLNLSFDTNLSIKREFPVSRSLLLDKVSYYSGSVQFQNRLGYEVSLFSENSPKEEIAYSGYRLSVTTFTGKPLNSSILNKTILKCQRVR